MSNYGKISDICDPKYDGINIVNSIGDINTKLRINSDLESFNLKWINCIHPAAYIAPTAKLGQGNIICYGAVINSDAKIGDFNLINTYAVVEHDCLIGDYNHIALVHVFAEV